MIKLLYPKFWQERNIIAYALFPLSLIYRFLGYLRHILASPIRLPAKVICVGNCSIGGTGKTQIVIYLAKLLTVEKISFAIVTKAYGSNLNDAVIVNTKHTALEVGDESVILAKYGSVIATKNIKQIQPLIHKLKPNIIIVDDSLQNPHFHKDVTIVAVDGERLFGNGFLIPAGPLREYPHKALNLADLIFLISNNCDNIPNVLMPYRNKLIEGQIIPRGIVNPVRFGYKEPRVNPILTNERKENDAGESKLIKYIDKTKNYFAFSGIGNPERFFITLKNYGLNIIGQEIFPDHYNYLQADLEKLYLLAKKHNATLITTRKDYVKINNPNNSIICLDVELSINNIDLLNEKIFKTD